MGRGMRTVIALVLAGNTRNGKAKCDRQPRGNCRTAHRTCIAFDPCPIHFPGPCQSGYSLTLVRFIEPADHPSSDRRR